VYVGEIECQTVFKQKEEEDSERKRIQRGRGFREEEDSERIQRGFREDSERIQRGRKEAPENVCFLSVCTDSPFEDLGCGVERVGDGGRAAVKALRNLEKDSSFFAVVGFLGFCVFCVRFEGWRKRG